MICITLHGDQMEGMLQEEEEQEQEQEQEQEDQKNSKNETLQDKI